MEQYLLFDLDGTISDSKLGITASVQYALRSFGIEVQDLDQLNPFIGPPLRESFQKYYGFTEEQAEEAVAKYRERYSAVGKFENDLYPGMDLLLRDLKAAGMHLAVASSKPQVFVDQILEHFGIRQYFEVVVGSALDGSFEKKEDILAEVIRRFFVGRAVELDKVTMIGDRSFDMEAAQAMGIHSIGVAYGFAAPGELERSGAEIIVHSVEDLRRVLLGYAGETEGRADRSPSGGDAGGGAGASKKKDTRPRRAWSAIGGSVLAMGSYFLVSNLVAGIFLAVTMFSRFRFFLFRLRPFPFAMDEDLLVNLANALGILAGFVFCACVWRKRIRLRPGKKIDRLSLLPMAVCACALPLGLNGLLNWMQLYRYSPAFQEVSSLQMGIPVWLGILTFGILAPLGEETVFRGLVYGNLRRAFSVPVSVILSGLAFGIFHGNLVQGVYASLLGFVLAIVYELYGTILIPMLFHSIANLFVYCLLDLTSLGDFFLSPPCCVAALVISALALVLMVSWQKYAEKA